MKKKRPQHFRSVPLASETVIDVEDLPDFLYGRYCRNGRPCTCNPLKLPANLKIVASTPEGEAAIARTDAVIERFKRLLN